MKKHIYISSKDKDKGKDKGEDKETRAKTKTKTNIRSGQLTSAQRRSLEIFQHASNRRFPIMPYSLFSRINAY